MKWLFSLLCVLVPMNGYAEDINTAAGLKYRDAIVFIQGTCSSVCVSPDGIYVSANHCGFEIGKTYTTNKGNEVKCVFNTGKREGVCVLVEENNIEPRTYLPLAFTPPKVGDEVYAIGYPAGKFNYAEAKIKRVNDNGYYTIDQRLFEGHSGGPLINEKDQVIGVLSSRSFLPGEGHGRFPPEANFIALESIYASLRACNMEFEKIEFKTKEIPKVIVFSTPGCLECERFKADYNAGKFPKEYQFEFVSVTNGGYNSTNPAMNLAYRQQFGYDVASFPTFWVYQSPKQQVGYIGGAIELISFIRGALKLIIGLIFGEDDARPEGNVPRANPTPPQDSPGLIQKIVELKGQIDNIKEKVEEIKVIRERVYEVLGKYESLAPLKDKIQSFESNNDQIQFLLKTYEVLKDNYGKVQNVESKVVEMLQLYRDNKDKIDGVASVIKNLKNGEEVDLIELVKNMDIVQNKVNEIREKYDITDEKIEKVKSVVDTVEAVSKGEYDLLKQPWMIITMLLSFGAGHIVKRKLA